MPAKDSKVMRSAQAGRSVRNRTGDWRQRLHALATVEAGSVVHDNAGPRAVGFPAVPYNLVIDELSCGPADTDGHTLRYFESRNLGRTDKRGNAAIRGLHAGRRESNHVAHRGDERTVSDVGT